MQGFPEYAFTTDKNPPDHSEAIRDACDADTAHLAGKATFTQLAWFRDSNLGGAFLAGYLAAVNRLPIFIVDPAEMLGKEADHE